MSNGQIVEKFEHIKKSLSESSGIQLQLNGSGILNIERELPFMLIYRPDSADESDTVIENILKNEASYMICPETDFREYKPLLKQIIKHLSDKFGAFLLLEIWPGEQKKAVDATIARFELYGPGQYLPRTLSPIKRFVEKMDLEGLVPKVRITTSATRCPDNRQPLLERDELKRLECLLMGLKIDPFYMEVETGQIYPLLERQLYAEFSHVFKRSVYDFVKVQTSHKISGFQSLASREIQEDVWEIDRQLVEIDSQIQFLMLVSPVNGYQAWKEFKKNDLKKAPVFHYRMMPTDPELLKRQLYNIHIEKIDDPTLGFLFREKRAEASKMLTMLNERDSADFFYGSLQLFGSVNNDLLKEAKGILKEYPVVRKKNYNNNRFFTAQEFAEIAMQELKFFQEQYSEVQLQIKIKDTIDSIMVEQGIFHIPANSKIPKERANALIQHEIGTHVLTYYNGKSQPLRLLSSGIPGYEELQEGIAVLAEYLSGGLNKERMQVLAARVIAVDSLINDRDFVKTFELLTEEYNFMPKEAFFITTRVYRGGGFTKDAIYLRGLTCLIDYLKDGNKLEPLLIGKIRQSYIPIIQELISRKVLDPMAITPRYLINEESLKRLHDIKDIHKITDLINI